MYLRMWWLQVLSMSELLMLLIFFSELGWESRSCFDDVRPHYVVLWVAWS
ncbi:hypothetical protein XF_0577 [Xylella fastidiosa 9a5c]|uniref:Uncharacterized protein n=1 Tax=Xylella fastidiosa (strain 9a5c) TaxID=160492 RepID=Q9PFT0_XYLFA|nr:hypothetical protein XF_0577 [Xylella fastidiosa 9a5c]